MKKILKLGDKGYGNHQKFDLDFIRDEANAIMTFCNPHKEAVQKKVSFGVYLPVKNGMKKAIMAHLKENFCGQADKEG